MGETTGYGFVLSFNGLPFGETTEHAFVHGFELGQLWQRMRSGTESEIEGTFHAINREAIERACAAEGWSVTITDATDETGKIYDTWVVVKLTKATRARSNPNGLRVVQ